MLQKELETSQLRDIVKMQQLSIVNVQSAVSGYVVCLVTTLNPSINSRLIVLGVMVQRLQEAVPHEMTICLGKDPERRRETLKTLKSRKILSSLAYLTERTRFLDPFHMFSETSRFEVDGGDYCVLCVDSKPFDISLVSVRQLYDALLAYLSNMDMRITDLTGDITTSDDIDYAIEGINQCRHESSLSCGVSLEKNTVTFHEFTDQSDEYGGGGPFGVLCVDSVDVDELYPYRPHQCVRLDITTVMTVRLHTRKRISIVTGREEYESVVVWTRAYFGKQRRTQTPLPYLVEHNLREQLGRWGDVMTSCVVEQIFGHR